ncbi:hypothetical protein [Bifidobacterium porcinum]|uniref:hypothetical protein n=1 Tax=Bifidobacterium porcinum TaxID=212365 RepID=UPI00126A1201|nr:hypothetical protein [Bifidobacterium porcinum]
MDVHESGQGIVTYISLIVKQSGQTKSQHLRESACDSEILREKSQHLSSTVLFADFFRFPAWHTRLPYLETVDIAGFSRLAAALITLQNLNFSRNQVSGASFPTFS